MPVRRRRGKPAGGQSCGKARPIRYLCQRDLPRLVPVLAGEHRASTLAEHGRLVAMLRRALRIERRRGIAGEWSYDLARHALLLEAYHIERDQLRARRAGRGIRTDWAR